jgi:hypothetical protein
MRRSVAVVGVVTLLAGGFGLWGPGHEPAAAADGPELAIGDVAVVEGNGSFQIVQLPLSLTSPAATDVTASFTLAPVSADTPADWRSASAATTVRLRAGVVSGSVKVKVLGDTDAELDEQVTATLSGVTGATPAAEVTGTVTILDDDTTPTPGISVGDVTIPEGDTKTRTAKVPLTLSAPAPADTLITLTRGGTAVRLTDDKLAATKTVRVRAGKSSAIASVPVVGDRLRERDESVELTASSVDLPTARATGAVTIRDEAADAGPVVAGAPVDLAFYTPPVVGTGPPGELVWSRVLSANGFVTTHLVLYRSTGARGKPVMVSGRVYEPAAPEPPEGRDVVAWAEGTTGLTDGCAPSRIGSVPPALADLIAAGHAVVATDFEGLGTPGPHAYLNAPSEAQSMLDAVRTVAELGVGATGRVVAYGGSRGGHAAIATAERSTYAPDVTVIGAVGLGAGVVEPTDAGQIDPLVLSPYRSFLMMSLRATQQLYGSSNAAVKALLDHYLTPTGKVELPNADGCNNPVIPYFSTFAPSTLFKLAPRPTITATADSLRQLGTVGTIGTVAPIVLMSGTSDPIVSPAMVDSWHAWACAGNAPIEKRWYPGGHYPTPTADIAAWIADRFAGAPPGDSCP